MTSLDERVVLVCPFWSASPYEVLAIPRHHAEHLVDASPKDLVAVGRALVAACEEEARRVGIPQLFAWTYEVGFFERCGFQLIDKSRDLHPRVWSECLRCPFYVGCNENGVVKRMDGVPMPANLPEPPPAQVPPGIR